MAAVVLLFAPGLVSPAAAADRGTIVKVGGDATVPQGDTASTVFVVGGDVTVGGRVTDALVNVGGTVRLLPTAVVGKTGSDGSLVLVGSTLRRASGSVVHGKTTTVNGSWAGSIWRSGVVDPVVRPFRAGALIGWAGSTVLYVLVALVIAALAPRQVTAIRDHIRQRFWPTLGWGALSAIIIVPVVTLLLVVSIIGILALLPWGLLVFVTFLFGAVGAAVLIGDLIMPALGSSRENLMLAGVLGVIVARVVDLIPIAGSIAVAILWIVGFGGAILAFWQWRRSRREEPGATVAPPSDQQQPLPPAAAA